MPTTAPHDIAPPPGASFVDDWQSGPPPYRIVLGATRVVGNVEVNTSVAQFAADGSVDQVGLIETPRVHVRSVDARDDLTVEQARQLVGAIIAATAELERVCG
jgi:hypothetical protein